MVIPVELSGCIFQAAAGSGVPWSDKLSHRVIDPVMRISHLEYMSIYLILNGFPFVHGFCWVNDSNFSRT